MPDHRVKVNKGVHFAGTHQIDCSFMPYISYQVCPSLMNG